MQTDIFIKLLEKYLDETIQLDEQHQLSQMLKDPDYNKLLHATFDTELAQHAYNTEPDEKIRQLIHHHLNLKIQANYLNTSSTPTADVKSAASDLSPTPYSPEMPPVVHRVHSLRTAWFRYAALVLLIAGSATFLYLKNRPQQEIARKQPTAQPDIAPGGNRAILTLADGSTIILDSAAIGNLASQGNTKILKLDAGSLTYTAGSNAGNEVLYNTISTPKGGQFQIILQDGTRVWLNAASSIRFPTVFLKNERRVEIAGEVYFEVAGESTRPFKVKAGDRVEVNVLGTHFNINAYPDENNISTTLTEGSVGVALLSSASTSAAILANRILTPGQQAKIASRAGQVTQESISIANNTDLEQTIAWKNNLFHFMDADLETVMRQLSRWYDLDVEYAAGIRANDNISGKMKRDLSLNQVLEGLSELGVHFKREGKKLTVMP